MTPAPKRFLIKKGLDVSVGGAPLQAIDRDVRGVTSVALLGEDYPGLRPSMLVGEGDRVRIGQPLFAERHDPQVRFTSPGSGIVTAIRRGARRSLEAVVIHLEGDDEVMFPSFDRGDLARLPAEQIRDALLASGLWTALRTRPYGKIAASDSVPHALFVTAIDTRPLAPDPVVVIGTERDAFSDGLTALGRLIDAPIFLCTTRGAEIPAGDPARVTVAEFRGPHPAGLPGTHIHLLAPVGGKRTAWYIGYQDVIALGRLLTAGRLPIDRVIALAGCGVRRPRLVRTRLGAAIDDMTRGELESFRLRVFSGCALAGRTVSPGNAFLGRYHNQVTVLLAIEDAHRGGRRPMLLRWRAAKTPVRPSAPLIPIDAFERVLPLDVLPAPLFRALLAGDLESAAALGCLELEEEDLALCRFVCPSGIDYGALLRSALTQIEIQG